MRFLVFRLWGWCQKNQITQLFEKMVADAIRRIRGKDGERMPIDRCPCCCSVLFMLFEKECGCLSKLQLFADYLVNKELNT